MPHKDPEARREYQRAYKAAHRERKRELDKQSYERHKDEIQARRVLQRATIPQEIKRERWRRYAAKWLAKHPFYGRDQQRAHYVPHPLPRKPPKEKQPRVRLTGDEKRERQRAATREWAKNNPDKLKAWKERNKEQLRARARAFQERNRERRRVAQLERYKQNPEKYRAWAMKYWALKRNATIGEIDYAAIITRDKGRCQICGTPVAVKDRSYDHIIPLSKGGPHQQGNLRLTHFVCNARRGNRTSAQPFLV